MRILLLANGRCGSYSVLDWIAEELNIKIFVENEPITIKDNYIVKRTTDNIPNLSEFDYIIKLYRENTILLAESETWAINNKIWHMIDGEKYVIPLRYLIDNHVGIWERKLNHDNNNKLLKSIEPGILVSYEEIFVNKTGQDMLSSYLEFNPLTRVGTDIKKDRTHIPDLSMHASLQIEYDELLDSMKMDTETHNRDYNHLVDMNDKKIEQMNVILDMVNENHKERVCVLYKIINAKIEIITKLEGIIGKITKKNII
jgi:hypothetical protein